MRRAGRRLAALALGTLAALTLQPLAAAAPAGPALAQAPETAPVGLQVSDLRPRAPRPGGSLQVVGSMTNAGGEPVRDLQVRIGVGGRLSSRAQLAQADAAPPLVVPRTVLPLDRDLAPGERADLDVRVDVDDLRLHADGVYPLRVEVRGLRGTSGLRTTVGTVSTYVPWFADREVDPLRIAWVLPLVDRPRQAPSGALVDDVLAESLAPAGRLGRLLRAGRAADAGQCPAAAQAPDDDADAPRERCVPGPVTWAVDPDLVHTAEAMTRPYTVLRGGDRTRPGTGTAEATAWLASLRDASRRGEVLALPYADPDVVALTRPASGLAGDVATAQTYGTTVAREVLGVEPVDQVALPPPGRLTDAAVDVLAAGRTQALVLADDVVSPPLEDLRLTPGARVRLPRPTAGGPLTGLLVERALTDLAQPRPGQGARLAEQRWLVETALVAAELPARGRTLVVALPRGADVDPALLGAALTDTGAVPWMCAVRLSDVAAGRERCPEGRAPSYEPERRADLLQPEPGAPELVAPLLARTEEVRAAAQQLTGAVIKGGTERTQSTRARLQRAWLRTESTAWRDDRRAGLRLARLLRDEVEDLRRKVSVLTGQVTLTSGNGQVSVAVVNELDQPVTVAVRLVAPAEARLSESQTPTIEVPARTSLPVQVQATTLTSGRFVVRAQLLDRDGAPFGAPQELIVNSTRYGTVALGVTGAAAAVLFGAVAVRLARRGLRSRAAQAAS